ncbi:DUF4352 domain-containing protein [Longispora albida]|uniref:DUF4352 domain-containing protein n=1 Tax=Longispora albida TaxID=203523 RepID=UPI000369AA7C|nr:DUF4352 domain-containing protein [Longispora albida]
MAMSGPPPEHQHTHLLPPERWEHGSKPGDRTTGLIVLGVLGGFLSLCLVAGAVFLLPRIQGPSFGDDGRFTRGQAEPVQVSPFAWPTRVPRPSPSVSPSAGPEATPVPGRTTPGVSKPAVPPAPSRQPVYVPKTKQAVPFGTRVEFEELGYQVRVRVGPLKTGVPPASEYSKDENGSGFTTADVEFTVLSGPAEGLPVAPTFFWLIDAGGGKHSVRFPGLVGSKQGLTSGAIKPGETRTGKLFYDVPVATATGAKIDYMISAVWQ